MTPAEVAPIMLVAGEASGDLHGATLCRALRSLAPARPLLGMGGERMAAAGLQPPARGGGARAAAERRGAAAGGANRRAAPAGRPRADRLPRVQSAPRPRGPTRRHSG